jgi:hypothetical protein
VSVNSAAASPIWARMVTYETLIASKNHLRHPHYHWPVTEDQKTGLLVRLARFVAIFPVHQVLVRRDARCFEVYKAEWCARNPVAH